MKEKSDAYKLGFNSDGHISTFEKEFGEPIGDAWREYLYGYSDKQELIRQEKKQLYNVDEFQRKLTSLCKEYNVTISIGCGCCDAGVYCNDINISEILKPDLV